MDPLSLLGIIILIIIVLRLRERVSRIERKFQAGPPTQPQAAPAAVYGESRGAPPASATATPPVTTAAPPQHVPADLTWLTSFVTWCKEDWLLKLGALLILIAFGWFARYAFLHNWIGAYTRIFLGIMAGVALLVLGWWRIKRFLHQGSVFLVLGSTTILLTIFAAREIYNFFTPLSALVVMFMSTAFVGLMSVQYRSRALALSSLALAGLAPWLTNAPDPSYVGLFSYLFVVTLGAVWVTVLARLREVTAAALVLITLYSLPHLVSFTHRDADTLLLFAYAFAALFFITNTAGILKARGANITADLVTAGGNGLFLLAWIMTAAEPEWRSLLISAWMVVFAAGAFSIFRLTKRREPFYVYAGVGIAMLAAATSAELDGAALTIAYTIESALVALIAYAVLRDINSAERAGLLLAGPMVLSYRSMISSAWWGSISRRGDLEKPTSFTTVPTWSDRVFHQDFFVLLILAATLLGLGLLFRALRARTGQHDARPYSLLLVIGSFYVYLLLWLSLHAGFNNRDVATTVALVVYTITGLTTYIYGKLHGQTWLRLYGGALLGFVVARLLFVDVWRLALTGRIITFFLVGALLVSSAFLGRRRLAVKQP